ncbi:MAG: hypothetical protein KME50_12965 [Nostoc desertorum CM1-VF14]|jgi:hypothetical protein|nr:hypothetical protein [Nostoc desertorum CM1-VF14]
MPLYRKRIVNGSSLDIPSDTRTVAGSNDFFIGIDENSELYKIKKSDLLVGLSSDTGGGTTPTTPTTGYPTGMALLLEDGSKLDKSGNDRHATPVGANSPTSVVGLDGKQVLKWDGSGTQELEITPFLSGATGATLYCVFTIESGDNYNIVRTIDVSGGDFWKFIGGSAGYFATFLQNRLEIYPPSMPATGSILVSIHSGSNYQILINNDSKGIKSNTFFAGNKFRIGVNDYPFVGSIATLLVYPEHIQPYTTKHNSIINVIKTRYTSLTLVS